MLTMLIFQIISKHTVLVHYNGYPEDCYFCHRRIVPAHQRHPPSHPLPGPSQKVPHDHKLPHHIPNHLGFPHGGHRLCLRFWKPPCHHGHLLVDHLKYGIHHFLHVVSTACRRGVSIQGERPHHETQDSCFHRRKLACVVRSWRPDVRSSTAPAGLLGAHTVFDHSHFGPPNGRYVLRDYLAHQTQAKILARIDVQSRSDDRSTPAKADGSFAVVGGGSRGDRRPELHRNGRVGRLQDLLRSPPRSQRLHSFLELLFSGRVPQFCSQSHYLRLAPSRLPTKSVLLLQKVTAFRRQQGRTVVSWFAISGNFLLIRIS